MNNFHFSVLKSQAYGVRSISHECELRIAGEWRDEFLPPSGARDCAPGAPHCRNSSIVCLISQTLCELAQTAIEQWESWAFFCHFSVTSEAAPWVNSHHEFSIPSKTAVQRPRSNNVRAFRTAQLPWSGQETDSQFNFLRHRTIKTFFKVTSPHAYTCIHGHLALLIPMCTGKQTAFSCPVRPKTVKR